MESKPIIVITSVEQSTKQPYCMHHARTRHLLVRVYEAQNM